MILILLNILLFEIYLTITKMSSIISLNEDYTQAAVAIFGNTKPYLTEIKKIGGIFNARLKYNGSTAAGWIFPKTKLQVVKQLVNKINSGEISPSEAEASNTEKESSVVKREYKKENTRESNDKSVVLSREEFMYIMNTLTRLDQEVNELKRKINPEAKREESKRAQKPQIVVESSEDDNCEDCEDEEEEEEEEVKPQKKGPSLLRRK